MGGVAGLGDDRGLVDNCGGCCLLISSFLRKIGLFWISDNGGGGCLQLSPFFRKIGLFWISEMSKPCEGIGLLWPLWITAGSLVRLPGISDVKLAVHTGMISF